MVICAIISQHSCITHLFGEQKNIPAAVNTVCCIAGFPAALIKGGNQPICGLALLMGISLLKLWQQIEQKVFIRWWGQKVSPA